MHGLERKGFGRGEGKPGKHTAKQAELQQLHAEVEERLRRTLHPSLLQECMPLAGVQGGEDDQVNQYSELKDIESRIAAKLSDIEGRLAS